MAAGGGRDARWGSGELIDFPVAGGLIESTEEVDAESANGFAAGFAIRALLTDDTHPFFTGGAVGFKGRNQECE